MRLERTPDVLTIFELFYDLSGSSNLSSKSKTTNLAQQEPNFEIGKETNVIEFPVKKTVNLCLTIFPFFLAEIAYKNYLKNLIISFSKSTSSGHIRIKKLVGFAARVNFGSISWVSLIFFICISFVRR